MSVPPTREAWLATLRRWALEDGPPAPSAAKLRRLRDELLIEDDEQPLPAESLQALQLVTDDDCARLAVEVRGSIRADAVIAAATEAEDAW